MSGHVLAIGWLLIFHLADITWARGLRFTSSQVAALNDHHEFFFENQPPPSPSIYELCANDLDYEECLSKRECERKWFGSSMHCQSRLRDTFWRRQGEVHVPLEQLMARFSGQSVYMALDEGNQTTPSSFTERPLEFGPRGEKWRNCEQLSERLIRDICRDPQREHNLPTLLEHLHFRACTRHSVGKALSPELYHLVLNTSSCEEVLSELLYLDELAEKFICEYESILDRYDCKAQWSVIWRCPDCRLAYRDWICSLFIPVFRVYENPSAQPDENGYLAPPISMQIKPCMSVCEQVEQKCPHLHPQAKDQYAGEPVFLCVDTNIPFSDEIPHTKLTFGEDSWCYTVCDLDTCYDERGEKPSLPEECMRPREVVIEQSSESYVTESYDTTSPITWMDDSNYTGFDSNSDSIYDWTKDVNLDEGLTSTTTTTTPHTSTDSVDKFGSEFVDINNDNEDYAEPFVEGGNLENLVTESPQLTTAMPGDSNEQFFDYDEVFRKQLMDDSLNKGKKSLTMPEPSFNDQLADNESEIEQLEEMDIYRMATGESTTKKSVELTNVQTTTETILATEDDDLPTSIKLIEPKPRYHHQADDGYLDLGNEDFFDEWERNRKMVMIPLYPKKEATPQPHNRHGHGHQPPEKQSVTIGTWTTLNPTPSSTFAASVSMASTSTVTSKLYSPKPSPPTLNPPNKLSQRIRAVVEPKLFKRPKPSKGQQQQQH